VPFVHHIGFTTPGGKFCVPYSLLWNSHGYRKSNCWTVILKKNVLLSMVIGPVIVVGVPAMDRTVSVSGPTFKHFSTWLRKHVLFEQKHVEL
jgi:hypothetical protein